MDTNHTAKQSYPAGGVQRNAAPSKRLVRPAPEVELTGIFGKLLPDLPDAGFEPRSQALLFGNAYFGNSVSAGSLETAYRELAFPNGVWEREESAAV
jgi:hypothetical protein